MICNIILLFLIGHLLGDFYFQTDKIACGKNKDTKILKKHVGIYFICMFIAFLPVLSTGVFIIILINTIFHAIIDICKNIISHWKNSNIFIIDQISHILVMLISIIVYRVLGYDFSYNIIGLKVIPFTLSTQILKFIFEILFIFKPCSIAIKEILSNYTIEDIGKIKDGKPNAGALIGKLERAFVFIMLCEGQYASIGFVLTAKSIARYKKISECEQFAEYYLLGTLLSILLVIVSYKIISYI